MSSASWESAGVEVSELGDRPRPSGEVMAVRRDRDGIKPVPGGTKLLRVLVADDNRDVADSFAQLVELWGHDVRVAYDGATVLETAAAYQPDVMLLDVAMPRMDGCCLARRFRLQTRFQDTLLVAVTGYADHEHRRLCQEAGFDHFLVKPVELETVKKLLQAQQVRRETAGRRGARS